ERARRGVHYPVRVRQARRRSRGGRGGARGGADGRGPAPVPSRAIERVALFLAHHRPEPAAYSRSKYSLPIRSEEKRPIAIRMDARIIAVQRARSTKPGSTSCSSVS